MKKTVYLMTLLFSTTLFAGDCSVYELRGTVKAIKYDLHLIVAERTGSELDLLIPVMIQTEFSPYVNKFVAGTFTVEGKEIQTRNKILGVQKIDFAVPDPLSQNQATSFKKIKEVVCPKI